MGSCKFIYLSLIVNHVIPELVNSSINLGGQGNLSVTDKTIARTEVKHSYCTSPTSLLDSHALKKRNLQDSLGFFLTCNFLFETNHYGCCLIGDMTIQVLHHLNNVRS